MPEIPRLGPGRVVPIRRVQPLDVGSGAGDFAFSNAADAVSQVSAQIQVAEQTSNVARGLASAGAELDAQLLDLMASLDVKNKQVLLATAEVLAKQQKS